MPIRKAGRNLVTIHDWQTYASPKSPGHWVDGRSAKEAAQAWLKAGDRFPQEVAAIFTAHPSFGPVLSWIAEPEAKLRFDSFKGEPSNCDLAVDAEDRQGHYLMAVEAKADEPFSSYLSEKLAKAKKREQENPRSNGVRRIEQLTTALLGATVDDDPSLGHIRYQLLTACAGALCEAERKGYQRAVLLVHEFITPRTNDRYHQRNARDLEAFVRRLSHGTIIEVKTGQLYGPFTVLGKPLLETPAALHIGKVTRNLRLHSACPPENTRKYYDIHPVSSGK